MRARTLSLVSVLVGATLGLAAPDDALVATRLGLDFAPSGLCLAPDGHALLVSCEETDRVFVWDWERDTEIKRIAVPAGPSGILVRGNRAYVVCGRARELAEVDVDAGRVVRRVSIPVLTGQEPPTAGRDPESPIFVNGREDSWGSPSSVVRVDMKSGVAALCTAVSHVLVHPTGRLAVVVNRSTRVDRLVTVSPTGEIGSSSLLGSLETNPWGDGRGARTRGVDPSGMAWFGDGVLFGVGLTHTLLRMDGATFGSHPSEPLLVGANIEFGRGTIALFSRPTCRSVFVRRVQLPALDRPTQDPPPIKDLLVPATRDRLVVLLRRGAHVERIVVPPERFSFGSAAGLETPVPGSIRAGVAWRFTCRLPGEDRHPTWKGLQLPPGCSLEATSGALVWESPTPGHHSLLIKATFGLGQDLVVSRRVTVLPKEPDGR